MREELKACPFCGGEAIARTRLGGIAGAVEIVGCTKCGADTQPFKTEAEAITAWNTRAKPQGDVGADSGLAAADDNHTQAEVSWRVFLASDKDWLADHGRKMGSGVGQQAIERLLIALDHVAADDNHKALVEAASRGHRALDSLRGKYDTGAVADQLKAALAAFQSRQEEK